MNTQLYFINLRSSYTSDLSNQTAAFNVCVKELLIKRNDFLTPLTPFEVGAIHANEITVLCKWSGKGFTTTFVSAIHQLLVESTNCSFISRS
jgi:hypothetical protein